MLFKSLYYLTMIYAHPAHVVDISCNSSTKTDSRIFQQNFLDDAIPTPPLDIAYPKMSVQPLSINGDSNTANPPAYAAASSTTSAVNDGQAFQKDPMWTLLSRMKILPRLAFLLENHQALMPVEAYCSICGLLCMVGQRSPGAASAIVQHDIFVRVLLKKMLDQIQQQVEAPSDSNDNSIREMIPYATMQLFCTLARQSKVAAEGLPLEEILPPLLASVSVSAGEFYCQQLALVTVEDCVTVWSGSTSLGVNAYGISQTLSITLLQRIFSFNRVSICICSGLGVFESSKKQRRRASICGRWPGSKNRSGFDYNSQLDNYIFGFHFEARSTRVLNSI